MLGSEGRIQHADVILIKVVNLILEKMTMPLKSYNKLWFGCKCLCIFLGRGPYFLNRFSKGTNVLFPVISLIFSHSLLSLWNDLYFIFSIFSYAKMIFLLTLQVTDYLLNKTILSQPSRVHCSLGYKQHYFYLY